MPDQQAFLLAQFDPKTKARRQQAENAAQLAKINRRAKDHHQQASVNRMAHDVIRSRPDQFMVLLESDIAAPVASERPTRPKREDQSTGTNRGPDELGKKRARKNLPTHWRLPFRKRQRPPAERNRNAMRQRGL